MLPAGAVPVICFYSSGRVSSALKSPYVFDITVDTTVGCRARSYEEGLVCRDKSIYVIRFHQKEDLTITGIKEF